MGGKQIKSKVWIKNRRAILRWRLRDAIKRGRWAKAAVLNIRIDELNRVLDEGTHGGFIGPPSFKHRAGRGGGQMK